MLPARRVGQIPLVGLIAFADGLLDPIDETGTTVYQAKMAAAATFKSALAHVETGLRGYVLNGHPHFLDAYGVGA